jgi:hypothetical protein
MTVKSEFQKFSEMTKRLLSESKKEFNRREAEWKKQPEKQCKTTKTSGRGVSRDSGEASSIAGVFLQGCSERLPTSSS